MSIKANEVQTNGESGFTLKVNKENFPLGGVPFEVKNVDKMVVEDNDNIYLLNNLTIYWQSEENGSVMVEGFYDTESSIVADKESDIAKELL